MQIQERSTVLIVPGLREHVPEHWQTLLAEKLLKETNKVRTVAPLEKDKLSCIARIKAIQHEIEQIDGSIVIVAHSAGVAMLLHWAQTYECPLKCHIKGALLAAPPDLDKGLPVGYPTLAELKINGWLPLPHTRLPFPSIIAASENDPLASLASVTGMALNWGSELINLGNVGHLNPASGFGEWPQAEELIARLEQFSFARVFGT